MRVVSELTRWLSKTNKYTKRINSLSETQRNLLFSSKLSFGTAGARGVMDVGSNALNSITVCELALAIAKYIKEQKKEVIIGYDTRKNSKAFAKLIAKCMTYYDVKNVVFKSFVPTPVITLACRNHSCYGIIVTASHNPKEYNGIKIIMPNGAQITNDIADEILKNLNEIDGFDYIKTIEKIKISDYAENIYEQEFFLSTCDCLSNLGVKDLSAKICYTALNGTATKLAKKLFKHYKIDVNYVQEQCKADGDFKTCPYPNPEVYEAFLLSIEEAQKSNRNYVFATDPDADRFGMIARNSEGNFEVINGTDIALLFADYICSRTKEKNAFICSTIVTNPNVLEIARLYNCEAYSTYTGFVNIAQTIFKNEKEKSFIFACEESNGYIVNTKLRDKDGFAPLILMVQIISEVEKQGKTLFQKLDELYERTGYVYAHNECLYLLQKPKNYVENVMAKLRSGNIPQKNILITDYLEKEQPSNILEFVQKNGDKVIIRPSGTEPKLKIYAFTKGENLLLAKRNAYNLSQYYYRFLEKV